MAEWNAGDYNQHSSLQVAMAQERLDSLVLKGTERILDVGCGDGKRTVQIAARVPGGSVLGVDPSEPMIALRGPTSARRRTPTWPSRWPTFATWLSRRNSICWCPSTPCTGSRIRMQPSPTCGQARS